MSSNPDVATQISAEPLFDFKEFRKRFNAAYNEWFSCNVISLDLRRIDTTLSYYKTLLVFVLEETRSVLYMNQIYSS
jgi:hypothetical protein